MNQTETQFLTMVLKDGRTIAVNVEGTSEELRHLEVSMEDAIKVGDLQSGSYGWALNPTRPLRSVSFMEQWIHDIRNPQEDNQPDDCVAPGRFSEDAY